MSAARGQSSRVRVLGARTDGAAVLGDMLSRAPDLGDARSWGAAACHVVVYGATRRGSR